MKKLKKIPQFKNEEQERDFWARHDSIEYIDWSQAQQISFSNLKPSTKTISLRLPENLLHKIKRVANQQDVPYQSLIKFLLAQEFFGRTRKRRV
jgi:predicted DNA binding CopG/RHH family protein